MEEILDLALHDESDDDDMEDALLLHLFNENLGNRAELYGRFNFDHMSNTEARSLFRFDRMDIPRLTTALGIPELVRTQDNISISGIEGLCILLRRLAYPNRLIDFLVTLIEHCQVS